jgi:MtN3 and saliva related transmembrane protein
MIEHVLPRWAFEWFGSIAAFCTTISFLPQLVKVWRRKSARDLSLLMLLVFDFGLVCWLVYGLGIGSRPIVAANAATLTLAVAILVLKFRYDRRSSLSRPGPSTIK